ncbi:hypothetical protein D5086_029047 [Populus alba]|uniref:Uncharacterized protein n=1 Tax=Populus alba TaxID=43335 RepID=A0ACC4ASD2_POPAL
MVSIWFFCTFILKSLKNHTSSGTKIRHPPSPPALPIIGHLHLLGSVLGTSLHSLAQRYGPFVQLRMGVSTCYVVSDAEIARETSQINQLVHLREDEMKKLVESMISISKQGESCDLRQAIMTMTNNVICRMSMSTRRLGDGANNEAREIKDLVLQVSLLGGKLSAAVEETLRLHPPSPVVLRASIEDCEINGFDVKANTRMLVNVYTIQRDPNLWKDMFLSFA